MLNRTQGLVLGFLVVAWSALIVITLVDPAVYAATFGISSTRQRRQWAAPAMLTLITSLIALLALGVVRRWSWLFWLLLVAFLAGVLRVPAAVLELSGWLPSSGPRWYVLVQAAAGVVQVAIGLVMLAGYRRAGHWGRA